MVVVFGFLIQAEPEPGLKQQRRLNLGLTLPVARTATNSLLLASMVVFGLRKIQVEPGLKH
jgi:hypothetical protein